MPFSLSAREQLLVDDPPHLLLTFPLPVGPGRIYLFCMDGRLLSQPYSPPAFPSGLRTFAPALVRLSCHFPI